MMPASHCPSYVVDTSVALKWYRESGERHVATARGLRDALCDGRCTLSAPDLLLIEMANALAVGQRAREESVQEAIRSARKLGIRFIQFDPDTLTRAIKLSASYNVTVYDTYFWAVALDARSTLVTADERFLRRVGRQPDIVALSELRLPDMIS